MTSVDTGRTMDEIAEGKSKVWHSNREPKASAVSTRARSVVARGAKKPEKTSAKMPSSLEPMYASIGTEIPGDGWTFEPKYDGVRVLAYATSSDVKLITRNGKEKAKQFPEIVGALKKLSAQLKRPLVLDGEIVALIDGEPARFQELQSRMHVKDTHIIERHTSSTPAALILFDILMDGDEVLLHEPLGRRQHDLRRVAGPCAAGAQREAERRTEHRHHLDGQAQSGRPAGLAAVASGAPVARMVGHGTKRVGVGVHAESSMA